MLRRENIRYEKAIELNVTNLDEEQYEPAKPFNYPFYLATTQEMVGGAEHRWLQVNFENKTQMAIMGVVHISAYLDDDHAVAASSYDHFASSGTAVSFAGTTDDDHKGGGKCNGKTKQLAIKAPAPHLAIADKVNEKKWDSLKLAAAVVGQHETCARYNEKKCPGGATKGKCPISDHMHLCASCGGRHPRLDCTATGLPKSQKRKRNGKK